MAIVVPGWPMNMRPARAAYLVETGWLEPGLLVFHSPTNDRKCWNPDHLVQGNRLEMAGTLTGIAARGSRHPDSVLTDEEVIEIYSAPGGRGVNARLAERYGVSRPLVVAIRTDKRKTWLTEHIRRVA